MPDAPDHRFTEQETAAIIARAARSQHAVAPVSESGLSLAELQEIGRAAGLSPTHVAAAAAALRAEQAPGGAGERFGLPREIRALRVIPVPVSDATWERMVATLRQHFGTAGHAGQVGRLREWTATTRSSSTERREELHVVLAPHELGAMLTLTQQKADARGVEYLTAGGTLGGTGLLFAAMPLVTALPAAMALLGGGLATLGVAFGVGGVASARAWARRRREGFEALLDRLELIARATG